MVKTSRLENGIIAVAQKQNHVGELLRQLDQEYASGAVQKGVTFQTDMISEPVAYFDFKWTLEALSNIVDNAIKYTPPGSSAKW